MTQERINEALVKCKDKQMINMMDNVKKSIQHFADENGKIDLNGIAVFTLTESIKYTHDFVQSLLTELFVDSQQN